MNAIPAGVMDGLNEAMLATLPAAVQRPQYARADTRIGIVHLGAGAFHRAHQAVYIDDLLASEPEWAICAVSLHSTAVRDRLLPQQGLYTLALLGEQARFRVIGSIREVLCARDQQDAVLSRLANPEVRLVTLTITEKGYCLSGDQLDLAAPEIAQDLATPTAPTSAIGYVVAGLRQRHASGVAPFTVLSCDNLPDNGGRLRRAVLDFADRIDPDLSGWIARTVSFPCSMVDSITPASDDALCARVAGELGCADGWPIQREPYTQWVVEDRFCNDRPQLERVGVVITDDVAGYDRAKLRLLNGAHSSLAYLGSLLELETVSAAMDHVVLGAFVERLMHASIVPELQAPAGFDVDSYVSAILQRFRNRSIAHRLAQIAWDGSQKIPLRLLATLSDALRAGHSIYRLCLPVAAWLHFVRRRAMQGAEIVDPLSEMLLSTGRRARGSAEHDVALFLAHRPIFGVLAEHGRFIDMLCAAYAALGDGGPVDVARALSEELALGHSVGRGH